MSCRRPYIRLNANSLAPVQKQNKLTFQNAMHNANSIKPIDVRSLKNVLFSEGILNKTGTENSETAKKINHHFTYSFFSRALFKN